MIGNDLVDLQQAATDSNWMRKGFLHKLFNAQEQQYIMLASRPREMVWLLWSMKEAAYKIDNKRSGIREFAPIKLACKLVTIANSHTEGQVNMDDRMYFTRSTILAADHIHTIAAVNYESLGSIKSVITPSACVNQHQQSSAACQSHHGRYLALIF